MANGVPVVRSSQADDLTLITSINQQLQEYKDQGAHVIGPLTLQAIPPMHRPVVVVVQIDPDPKHSEVYKAFRGEGLCISALGWKKIGDGMGVQWVPQACGRVDDGTNPRKLTYRMYGLVKSLEGTWTPLMADKEINLDVIEEEILDNYRDKATAYLNDPKDGPVFRKNFPTPDAVEKWVKDKTRADVLQIQKHMLARAQSGAMAKAIRNSGIRETYTVAELAHPFVFRKFVFCADPNNPQDRQFLLEQASGAATMLYPKSSAPASRVALPSSESLPPAEPVIFTETGETAPQPEPSKEDQTRADFGGSDLDGQVQILKELVHRKGYTKTVRGELKAWKADERRGFLDLLLALPDATTKKPEPEPGKLPWE